MMPRINRGELRHEISFYTVSKTTGAYGGAETEVLYYSCWAAIWPVSANEMVKNDHIDMKTTHRLRIDYKSGILPNMRIYYGSRVFEIVSIVNPEERNVLLDILAIEK